MVYDNFNFRLQDFIYNIINTLLIFQNIPYRLSETIVDANSVKIEFIKF